MHSSSFIGPFALVLMGMLPHSANASQQYVTCEQISHQEKNSEAARAGQENWQAMAKIVCSAVEKMREMSAGNETKAEQDEIHRLYLAAVDGETLKLRAVPGCMKPSLQDGDLETRVVKIVRGFIAQNGATLRQSTNPIQIMAIARWPEKLEGKVDTGEGDPVPISWLFRCKSAEECKIIDIQITGSMSMTDSIRGELSSSAHCRN